MHYNKIVKLIPLFTHPLHFFCLSCDCCILYPEQYTFFPCIPSWENVLINNIHYNKINTLRYVYYTYRVLSKSFIYQWMYNRVPLKEY